MALRIALARRRNARRFASTESVRKMQFTVDKDTIFDRWEIIGRRLRNVTDINTAYGFAQDVVARTKLPTGLRVDPVVTRIGRDIWVGFVERGRIEVRPVGFDELVVEILTA